MSRVVIRDPRKLSGTMRGSLVAFCHSKNVRALTIRQPWVSALLDPESGKIVENRKRTTKPGWICLHVAKKAESPKNLPSELKTLWPGLTAACDNKKRGIALGSIVAVAHIAAIESAGDDPLDLWRDVDDDNHCYRFDVILPLQEPAPCSGQLGVWYVKDKCVWQRVTSQLPID